MGLTRNERKRARTRARSAERKAKIEEVEKLKSELAAVKASGSGSKRSRSISSQGSFCSLESADSDQYNFEPVPNTVTQTSISSSALDKDGKIVSTKGNSLRPRKVVRLSAADGSGGNTKVGHATFTHADRSTPAVHSKGSPKKSEKATTDKK